MKRILWTLLMGFVLSGGSAAAQELAGRIEGTVLDESKAVVPGANVTATHVATNVVYQATTTEAGRFVMPRVRLGTYRVEVEAPGFRRAVVTNVVVQVGGTADVNVTLRVGALAEEVVVTGEVAQEIINTTDAELASVVDERRVLELPLDGRNASHLLLLQAGVYFERTSTGQGNKLIIHGQRHRSLNISLDGVDTQDNLNRASSIMLDQPLIAMAAENVQEFRVITGNSSAEFSRGGVQMAAVTRSGSNAFHGSVFWFHRNDVFRANSFFNNTVGAEVPKLIRNQFGGRIGGPIVKDKTFFYFGYEQTRLSQGIPVLRTVYTAEARQGLFRYLDDLLTTPENVAANPGLIRTVNLLECGANVQAILGRDCADSRFNLTSPAVSGNAVALDPLIGGPLLAAIPLPNNFEVGDGLNTGGFRFNSKSRTFQHLPAFRLDHRFNDKHSFYGSINYTDRDIEGDFINGRETIFPDLGPLGSRLTHSRQFAGAFNSSFSPTLINEVRFGMVSGENAFLRHQPFGTPFTLNLNDVTDPYEPGGGPSVRDNETWHLRDTLSWVRGKHTIKAGAEFRHRWLHNYSFFEDIPEILFDDDDNVPGFSETDLRAMSTGGSVTDIESTDMEAARDSINDLLGAIGTVEIRYNVSSLTSGFVLGAPERRLYRTREVDAFFNDSWALHPRLTLNLGLRWEFATVPLETQGLLLLPDGGEDAPFGVSGRAGWFNPGVFAGHSCQSTFPSGLDSLSLARSSANAVNMITSCATTYSPGGSNNGRRLWDNDYNNFGPVIGIAWDPFGTGKTSIRAGYRISYMQDHFAIIDGNVDDNEGFTVDQDCELPNFECTDTPPAPFLLRDISGLNVAAPVPMFQLPAVRTILDSTAQDFRTYIKDLETPYYQEWNLSLEREFLPDTSIRVSYVGNRGVKLRRVQDFNEINIFAFDPVSGMTFMDAFLIAQQNLACNRASGFGSRFDDATGAACIIPNPLTADLIAGEPSRLRGDSAMVAALDFNEPGDFIDDYTFDTTSRPGSGESRIRGGAWWGAVLEGRFPANFFQANPFVASARAMANDGFSTYHALEVEARRRFSAGLTFQANYTFGKALADFDGDENTLINDVRPSSTRNPRYNTQQFMPRHMFTANWIWELPFGQGRRLVPESALLNKLAGGWQFGGIINFRTGRPISIFTGNGTFHRTA